MGRQKGKVVCIDEFDVTLRGARVVRAHGGSENKLGQTLSWVSGIVRQHDGGCSIEFIDQNGDVCARTNVRVNQVRTVRRVIERARRVALRRGHYELTVSVTKLERVLAIVGVLAFVAIIVWISLRMLIPMSRGVLATAGQFGAWWIDITAVVLLWFTFLHLPVICLIFVSSAARRNVQTFHVSRDGLAATTWQGVDHVLAWSDVRSVRRGMLGFAVRADGHPTLRMAGKHASFVLDHWAQTISPRPKASIKRLLIIGFLLCQAGGIVAYFMHRAGIPIGMALHPVVAYLIVGWGLPLVACLKPLLTVGIRRSAERMARKKKQRNRLFVDVVRPGI